MSEPTISAEDRKEAMAKRIATKPHWWQTGYMNALERVKTPGELGEIADTESASIEPAFPDLVAVFVAHHEEHIDFSPDECRELAFDLLVLADFAELAGGKDQ